MTAGRRPVEDDELAWTLERMIGGGIVIAPHLRLSARGVELAGRAVRVTTAEVRVGHEPSMRVGRRCARGRVAPGRSRGELTVRRGTPDNPKSSGGT